MNVPPVLLPLVLAAGALAGPLAHAAAAQVTRTVNLSGTSFSDPDLVIDVGDTVEWVWIDGFHNVESGVDGIPDGIFRSGDPVFPPMTFSVTFDQAFLDANPVPGKVYDYYCIAHVAFGMEGTVTVRVPSLLSARNAGANPASLAVVGTPSLGESLFVTVDLTTSGHDMALLFGFDTQASLTLAGGQTLLCLDLGGDGELLGRTAQSGPTAGFLLPLPNEVSLCGYSFTMQAIQFGGVSPFALSDARDVTIGNS